jgi:serine/threonine-protein phosphatase 6 regulatory ankyrin repeat subunit B
LKFKINDETASLLIERGAIARSKDFSGQIPSHLASFNGDKNLVAFLIAEGAEIDDRDNKGETALPINGCRLIDSVLG